GSVALALQRHEGKGVSHGAGMTSPPRARFEPLAPPPPGPGHSRPCTPPRQSPGVVGREEPRSTRSLSARMHESATIRQRMAAAKTHRKAPPPSLPATTPPPPLPPLPP